MPCIYSASYADLERSGREAANQLKGAVSNKNAAGEVVGCTSFWTDEIRPHAPFALELTSLEAQGGNPVAFNQSGVKFKVPRATDGLYKSAVAHKRVGIFSYSVVEDRKVLATGDNAAYWIGGWGFAASPLIKITTSEGQDICNPRSGLADYIQNATNVASDQQMHEAIHLFENADGTEDVAKLQAYSRNSSIVYHPMGFSKDRFTGKVLLMSTLYLAGAAIEVNFAAKEALYIVPGQSSGAPVYVRPDGLSDAALQARLDAGWQPSLLQDSDLKASIEAMVFGVEEEERADLISRPIDQLWEEVKEIRKVVPSPVNGTAGEAYEYEVKFTEQHLIGRYTLVARTASSLRANQPFNFGGVVDVDTKIQQPIIKSAGVIFGTSVRMPMRPDIYLREYAYAAHGFARIPRGKFINQLCWQVDVQDPDHTGGADHLVIEEVILPVLFEAGVFTPESPTVDLRVFLHYHRFLRMREGGIISRYVRL